MQLLKACGLVLGIIGCLATSRQQTTTPGLEYIALLETGVPTSVRVRYQVSSYGLREEYLDDSLLIKKGMVRLETRTGSIVLLDPVAHTSSKAPTFQSMLETLGPQQFIPSVSFQPSGKVDVIAGVRARQILFELRSPMPPGWQGEPAPVTAVGEIWAAVDKYADHGAVISSLSAATLSRRGGLEPSEPVGFILKRVTRILDRENRFEILSVKEELLPIAAFQVPSGYSEIVRR